MKKPRSRITSSRANAKQQPTTGTFDPAFFHPPRPIKTPVLARIDADVLAWLKSDGAGHLTRLNAILREAMERDTR